MAIKVFKGLKIERTYRISQKNIKIDKIWQEYYYSLNHAQIAFCISFKFGAVGIVWDIRWVRAIMAWAWFSNLSLIRLFLIATSFSKSRAPPTPKKIEKKKKNDQNVRSKKTQRRENFGIFCHLRRFYMKSISEKQEVLKMLFLPFLGLWILLIW